MPSSRRALRQLSFERLDDRLPMAGNVTVSLQGGSLVITGDGNSNGIAVSPYIRDRVNPGLVVAGITRDGAPTLINGGSRALVFVPFSGNIQIDLRDGGDFLDFNYDPTALDPVLRVPLNDRLGVGGDLVISMGTGRDRVEIQAVDVAGRTIVDLGDGSDAIHVNSLFSGRIGPGDDVLVMGGGHADLMDLRGLYVEGDLQVDGGGGDDTDQVFLDYSNIFGFTLIQTHGGDDTVYVAEVDTHHLTIETGAGTDRATLDEVSTDYLFALLGSGDNDFLSLDGVSAISATVDGGDGGGDRLDLLDGLAFEELNESRFEVIVD